MIFPERPTPAEWKPPPAPTSPTSIRKWTSDPRGWQTKLKHAHRFTEKKMEMQVFHQLTQTNKVSWGKSLASQQRNVVDGVTSAITGLCHVQKLSWTLEAERVSWSPTSPNKNALESHTKLHHDEACGRALTSLKLCLGSQELCWEAKKMLSCWVLTNCKLDCSCEKVMVKKNTGNRLLLQT